MGNITVPMGKYTKIRTGKLDANASSSDGDYPFFTCSREPLKISSYSYDCECVLVAGNGDLNIKYYSGKFDAYQRTYIIESTDKQILNTRYLYYFLDKYVEKLREQSIGGVIKYIKLGNLTEANIPLPSLSAQQQIADVLDRASALIEKRKAQINKLDLLVKSQFIEMFGDPVTNPKGWEIVRLGESCVTNPKKKEIEDIPLDTEISFVGMADVSETGHIETSHLTTIAKCSKGFTYFAENDVLFAKITPCMENGKGAIARGLYNGIGFGSTEFHVLRPVKGVSNSEWLFYLTYLDLFRKQAEMNMTGSAGQKRVPIKFIETYSVPLPPISIQTQFANFVQVIETQKSLLQQSLAKLEQSYKSLMQKCFRGEIF